MQAVLLLAAGLVAAFLLGSVPWGLVISQGIYHRDLRSVGSGNVGTTNAIRALGKVGGYMVFVLDFAKGILSGLVGMLCAWCAAKQGWAVPFDPVIWQQICLAACVLCCCLGHVFSPWLHFKGGKGIACSAGCLGVAFGIVPLVVLVIIFATVVFFSKYVSLGSVCCAVAAAIMTPVVYWGNPIAIACILATVAVIIWAHRENIARLRSGTERKIGQRV